MRLKIFHIIIVVFFSVALSGLIYSQIFKGGSYYVLSKNNCIRIIPQEARRGLILDRNGIVLADNRISFDTAVIPQEINDKDKVFLSLGRLLGRSRQEFDREYKKNVTFPFVPVIVAQAIDKQQAIILEQKKSEFPGVIVQTNARRFYPFYAATAHVLGYVGEIDKERISRLKVYGYKAKDIIGYSGIEESYDRFLLGQEGGAQVEVDNRGRLVRIIADRLAERGKDITLTLDLRVQQVAASLLEGKAGAIIVMDCRNGEILAMASSPAFDPNIFIAKDSPEKIKNLLNNRQFPLLNRAISGLYSPGSVFKAVVAIAARQSQKIDSHTSFFCQGKLNLGGRIFNCWSKHSEQDLRAAIIHSCNVFFYNLGRILGPDLMNKYALEFGLGSLTGIDLPFEVKGLVPSRSQKKQMKKESWYPGDSLNFSIGQGDLLITPIQLVKMMALFANDGMMVKPHLLKAIEGKETPHPKNYAKINIKSQLLSEIKSGLREVVKSPTGTANILELENLSVAGKTGTVQTSETGRQHAWFVGFAPYEKPRIVFCVFLEHGGSSVESCILAKELLQEMLKQEFF